jgi:hypothetical protein
MTQADRVLSTPRTNSSSLSRRQSIVAGVALLAALPAGAVAATTAFAELDPVFSSIQDCRSAKGDSDAAFARVDQLNKLAEKTVGSSREARDAFIKQTIGEHPDDYIDRFMSVLSASYDAFARTVPTTSAGLSAMLAFADEVTDRTPEVFNDGVIFSTLATAAKALMRA